MAAAPSARTSVGQLIVPVEGNIGAGKTTIFEALANYPDTSEWRFIPEPVPEWMNAYGTGINVLDRFYHDQRREALTIQALVLETQLTHLENALQSGAQIIVSDRSLFSAKECFAKLLSEEGKLDRAQWILYSRIFERLTRSVPPMNGIVYIRSSPEVCLSRVKERSRKEETESSLSLDYLQKLDEKHVQWFSTLSAKIPIHIVDSTMMDFRKTGSDRMRTVNDVVEFVKGLHRGELVQRTKKRDDGWTKGGSKVGTSDCHGRQESDPEFGLFD